MAKSKHRKKRKTPKVKRTIKVIKCTEQEKIKGAETMLERDLNQILELINERKLVDSKSNEHRNLTYKINTLVSSYNHSAKLWNKQQI